MALKKCFECGNQVSTTATACPHCGAAPKKTSGFRKVLLIIAGVIFIPPFLVLFAGMFFSGSSSTTDSSQEEFEKKIEERYQALVRRHKAGDPEGAQGFITQFQKGGRMNYKDVTSIAKSVRTMAALKQAQSIDPADTRKLAEAYANLARMEPENAEHQSKAVRYASEWKEVQEKQSAEEAVKMLAEAKRLFAAEDFVGAGALIQQLKTTKPQSPEAKEADALGKELEKAAEAHAVRIAAEKEVARKKSAENRTRVMASLRQSRDEVEGITWYAHKSSPQGNSRSAILAYIGSKNNAPWLRMKITYSADDWLFVEGYTFSIDGKNETLELSYSDKKSDHSGGTVWEWSDTMVDAKHFQMLDRIAKSERTILRYRGKQYYKDRDVTPGEKQAIREVLQAYMVLSGVEITE